MVEMEENVKMKYIHIWGEILGYLFPGKIMYNTQIRKIAKSVAEHGNRDRYLMYRMFLK